MHLKGSPWFHRYSKALQEETVTTSTITQQRALHPVTEPEKRVTAAGVSVRMRAVPQHTGRQKRVGKSQCFWGRSATNTQSPLAAQRQHLVMCFQ